MSRTIETFDRFDRQIKRLSKKYKTLKGEITELSEILKISPKRGASLGSGLYKIRLGSQSKGKGKRGGFRVVTYYIEQVGDDEVVYLVTIYDKLEEDNMTKVQLISFVEDEFDENND